MVAYISGQAARAVLVKGDKIKVFDLDADDCTSSEFHISKLDALFMGAKDVQEYNFTSSTSILRELKVAYEKDRALLLVLALLDDSTSNEICEEIPPVLDEFCSDTKVYSFLENRLYSYPLPESGNLIKAVEFSEGFPLILKLLTELRENQRPIEICRKSWDKLDVSGYAGTDDKNFLSSMFISEGVFAKAAKAIAAGDAKRINFLNLEVLGNQSITRIPNSRKMLQTWLNSIAPDKLGTTLDKNWSVILKLDQEYEYKPDVAYSQKPAQAHEVFQQVTKQIEVIKKRIQYLDLATARRYVEDLINYQLSNGSSNKKYAAKSLSNIATYALDCYQHSLSLELNQKAVELCPEDGWAWSALADSYISLNQMDDAETALEHAEAGGDYMYVQHARVRILKLQNRKDEAAYGYEDLIRKYRGFDNYWTILLGLASLYRDVWEFEKAFELLNEALLADPYQSQIYCALGALYMEVGDWVNSLKHYQESLKLAEITLEGYLGCSRVYKEMGNFEEALPLLFEAQKKFVDRHEPHEELGNIYRLMGENEKALERHEYVKKSYPYTYSGYVEKANTLVEMGRFKEAEREFQLVINNELYERDAGFEIKFAFFLKKIGKFDDSLRRYSEIRRKYPQNMNACIGQAELLKELGRYKDAISFYENVRENERFEPIVTASLAAIYVAEGKSADVIKMISDDKPKTKTDWVAYHIKGMAFLKLEQFDRALSYFQSGLENTPFLQQRNYFKSAIAIVYLKQSKYQQALEATKGIASFPLGRVIQLHTYCGLNNYQKANHIYNEIRKLHSNDNISALSDELAAHFLLNRKKTRHDKKWIFELECNILAIGMSVVREEAA